MTTFKPAAFKPDLSIPAMLLGLLLLNATAAHAVPVRVDTLFQAGGLGGPTVSTEAFFDDTSRGGPGSGVVGIQIDVYSLVFSDFGPALADLSMSAPGFIAFFSDGVLSSISGGPVPFIPPPFSPANFATVALEPPGLNRLILLFQISGRNNFDLVSRSDTIALAQTTNIPEPGALALFGVGLLGIGAVARRRRKAA